MKDFDNDLGASRVSGVVNLLGRLCDVQPHRALLIDNSRILIMILVPKVRHPIMAE